MDIRVPLFRDARTPEFQQEQAFGKPRKRHLGNWALNLKSGLMKLLFLVVSSGVAFHGNEMAVKP